MARSPTSRPPRGAKGAAPGLEVRERILDRTIYLMGKMGTTEVSVRAIAREADVNVSAVNYYFSSKEQMLVQMAERFTVGFDAVMELLESPDLPAETRLRTWAAEVMRYLAEYPGILILMERQIAADPLDPFGEALGTAMQRASRKLKAVLGEIVGSKDEQRLTFKLTLFISALAGPFPRQLGPQAQPESAPSPTERTRFLELLFDHLRA